MRKLLILLLIVAASGGGWWWWQGRSAKDGEPRILETARVAKGTVREVLEATGIIQPQVGAEVKIGARATGFIQAMNVKVGDQVVQGQLLAVIDDRELESQRREAQARLDKALAELARVEQVYPLNIKEAAAELDEAQAKLDYARKSLERKARLVKAKQTTQDDLDQASQNAVVAQKVVAAREATIERLRAEQARELQKARQGVAEARAALESIDIRISYTRIVSPMNGTVSQVAAQAGETVVAGLQVANLVTVLDPSRLEMWIYVDETDIGRVKPGMQVEFTVDAYPDDVFHGQVDTIYPQPEVRDNIVYYQALVRLDADTAARLRPDMTTQCRVVVRSRRDVLMLPNNGLKWVDGKQVVFARGPGGAVRRVTPELGLMGLDSSEVLSGLAEGDEVATSIVLPGQAKKPAARPGPRP